MMLLQWNNKSTVTDAILGSILPTLIFAGKLKFEQILTLLVALYHALSYSGELGLEQVGLYSILFGLQERGHLERFGLHGWAGAIA